ncbi:MAG TPA: polysaccharide deacetylase family protein [bacterium]|nr:polysaccharide deacetylase family protein [bacterium]
MGLTWAAARFNRRKILVLGYHDLYADAVDPVDNFDGLRVGRDRFERQMRYVAAHYHVVPLDQLLDPSVSSRDGKPLAAITFDDGYKNVYHVAYPVLRQLGLPATVFVIPDFSLHGRMPWWERLRALVAGTRRPVAIVPIQGMRRYVPLITVGDREELLVQLAAELHGVPPEAREESLTRLAADLGAEERSQPRSAPLSVDELREMISGGITVGSHGRSHDSFLHLSYQALFAELTESKQILELVTGQPVTWLAYPYGDYSGTSIDAVRRAGYRGAVTTSPRLYDAAADPHAIPRICVDDNLSFAHFIVAVSGLGDFLKSVLRISKVGRPEKALVPSDLA